MNSLVAWQRKHKQVMKEFLLRLNETSNDFVLNGGTALMFCYGLTRFSENIYFDCCGKKLKDFVKNFCDERNYNYRIAKDTAIVNRFMINYGDASHPLKIEISYRNKNICTENLQKINGILVYSIDKLCQLKLNAYQGRDKIRDLFDICFICNKHMKELSKRTKEQLQVALTYKDFEYFDYIVQTQTDPLIDKNKLANDYLNMFDKLNLLYTKDEEKLLFSEQKSR